MRILKDCINKFLKDYNVGDLINFDCSINRITKIENLPDSLLYIDCSYNDINKIENLPDSLLFFNCRANNIIKIENLPNKLECFNCTTNRIIKIENLPNYLQRFYCDIDNIEFVDNIPLNHYIFNNKFDLDWYNTFKKIQRRIRRRHVKKVNAIKLIQKNCENWLWKPMCKDGSIGINAILTWKAISLPINKSRFKF